MSIRLMGQDFGFSGYDRGGLLPVGLRRPRLSPCSSPFKEILIGYDGQVVPCCNIHPNSPAHASYVVGQVTPDRGILEIFGSQRQVAWRRALLRHGPQTGPCASCTRAECGPTNPDELARYDRGCEALLGGGDGDGDGDR
jgi:hypothetical protein